MRRDTGNLMEGLDGDDAIYVLTVGGEIVYAAHFDPNGAVEDWHAGCPPPPPAPLPLGPEPEVPRWAL